ncbi:MAG: hypothetical protein QM795_07935 [Pseudoxanthomonas sp.]
MNETPALADLFDQLHAMRAALHADELDGVEALLNRHDRDVRAFLHADGGRSAGYDAMATLLRAQLELQQDMQAAREQARIRMQSTQRADRAARAYLSVVGG